MFRFLVVDDEEIARMNINTLLSQRADVSFIQHACDGRQAIDMLEHEQFDIILLDIQMPRSNGLEVAQHISASTAVVFLTAHDEHAIEAFELHAVDYVLKPFETERFQCAIQRAVERCNNYKYSSSDNFERLIKSLIEQKHTEQCTKLTLKEVGKIKLIDPNNIKYIKGAGNYVEIVLIDNKTLLHRETLRDIEGRLCSERFSRIHKSTIVRNDLIIELRPTPKGDYVVQLSTGEELMLSRRNKGKLKRIFHN
jgi:two-component system LytT family response regulator